jgi:hypothetical protein
MAVSTASRAVDSQHTLVAVPTMMMLNHKVFFVSDPNTCRTDEEHSATLAILMVMFADVRRQAVLGGQSGSAADEVI